jgi:hypothetical protein
MPISADESPPSGLPAPPNPDAVLGYVTVEGNPDDLVTAGEFTSDGSWSDVHPAGVTAARYDGSTWQSVPARPVDGSISEDGSPVGYSTFAIGTTRNRPSTRTPMPTATRMRRGAPTETAGPTPPPRPQRQPVSIRLDPKARPRRPVPRRPDSATSWC